MEPLAGRNDWASTTKSNFRWIKFRFREEEALIESTQGATSEKATQNMKYDIHGREQENKPREQ